MTGQPSGWEEGQILFRG